MTSNDAKVLRSLADWFNKFDALFDVAVMRFDGKGPEGNLQSELNRIADDIDAKCTTPG